MSSNYLYFLSEYSIFLTQIDIMQATRKWLWHCECKYTNKWCWNWWCFRRRKSYRRWPWSRKWFLETVHATIDLVNLIKHSNGFICLIISICMARSDILHCKNSVMPFKSILIWYAIKRRKLIILFIYFYNCSLAVL